MKKHISGFSIFLFPLTISLAMIFLSCASKQKVINYDPSKEVDLGYTSTKSYNNTGSSNSVEPNIGNPSNLELSDMLRRVSGVTVIGKGPNVRIKVRGASSFVSNSEPLFVVDGIPLGTQYSTVANSINPNDIKSIRALSGPDATLYGARGANGVILIKMKK